MDDSVSVIWAECNMQIEQSIPELMNGCQGLVRSIAWKIHQKVRRNVELEDLIGYGQVGLAEAARDFDQGRGNQFTTYAYHRIRGAILDGLSTMSWFKKADYHRGRYEYAAGEVLQESGTENESLGDIEWFVRTSRALSGAYLMTHLPESGDDSDFVVKSKDADPSDRLDRFETNARIQSLLAELPDQARTLVQRIYFDGWSIKDAGEEIGISKAWASRLHARTLETLSVKLCASD